MELVVTLHQSYNDIELRFRDGEVDISKLFEVFTVLMEAGEGLKISMKYERRNESDD